MKLHNLSSPDKLTTLYTAGVSVKTLASEHSVAVGTMYSFLRKHTKMRPRGNRKGNLRSHKRAKIEQALRVGAKVSLAEIARNVGVSREYARRIAELSGHTQYRNKSGDGHRKVHSVGSRDGKRMKQVQEFDTEGKLVSDSWA